MNKLRKHIVIAAVVLSLAIGTLASAAGLVRSGTSDTVSAYQNLPQLACQHQGGSGGGC